MKQKRSREDGAGIRVGTLQMQTGGSAVPWPPLPSHAALNLIFAQNRVTPHLGSPEGQEVKK